MNQVLSIRILELLNEMVQVQNRSITKTPKLNGQHGSKIEIKRSIKTEKEMNQFETAK